MEDGMMDMGRKEKYANLSSKPSEPKVNYPTMTLRGDKIPKELKDMKVGDMAECHIAIKKVGDTIDTYDGNKPRVEVEIHKLGMMKKNNNMLKDKMSKHKPM